MSVIQFNLHRIPWSMFFESVQLNFRMVKIVLTSTILIYLLRRKLERGMGELSELSAFHINALKYRCFSEVCLTGLNNPSLEIGF